MKKARADWIAFIDSDDAVHPQYLEILYRGLLEQHARISLCEYIEAETVPENFFGEAAACEASFRELSDSVYAASVKEIKCFDDVVWRMLIAKDILERFPFTEGRIFEDTAVVCRWMIAAKKIAVFKCPLYFYRLNPSGTVCSADNSIRQADILWAHNRRLECFAQNRYEETLRVFTRISMFRAVTTLDLFTETCPNRDGVKRVKKEFREMERKYGRYAVMTPEEAEWILWKFHKGRYWMHIFHQILKRDGFLRTVYKGIRRVGKKLLKR